MPFTDSGGPLFMTHAELPKAYEANTVDPKWYSFWEKIGAFSPKSSAKAPYCIVIPPPNVTGALHMGHALVNTLIDTLIRWKRMQGHPTLWIPGTDHAGIATQTVVERDLMRKEGKRRTEMPREAFVQRIWDWKAEYEGRILGQLKKIGSSCDWSRLHFTMDETCNRSVKTIFKKLYDQGLIYQGDYLVNWDPVSGTALADDEVEYEEKQGSLWTLSYPLEDGSGAILVATTRPETMLGDTAVAVNPKDARYTHLIGKNVRLPITGRLIPIIPDPFVDLTFGTGAVKVTPAHDPNDYQMGLRHNLPMINIMTPTAHLNENAGSFCGLSVEDAREAVLKTLKEAQALIKIEPHILRVGVSYRSKATIQPMLSKQWFVRMEPFKARLRQVVESEEIKLLPKSWESVYFHWIDNLRDWCISRQLWWGHRIPVWHNKNDPTRKICYEGEGLPSEVAQAPDEWEQDADVLDTWFSSALWPFSTLGWPEKTADFEQFYPNAVLVTGHDILFFWVARMIMMGEEACGKIPFKEVFLHGLIYGKSYWTKKQRWVILISTRSRKKSLRPGSSPAKRDTIEVGKDVQNKGQCDRPPRNH
jgi:valyl-tRNA synthetase